MQATIEHSKPENASLVQLTTAFCRIANPQVVLVIQTKLLIVMVSRIRYKQFLGSRANYPLL